jgi:hypothetical protein
VNVQTNEPTDFRIRTCKRCLRRFLMPKGLRSPGGLCPTCQPSLPGLDRT